MANGDEAVTAGMDKVLGTADRRLGYDEINKTRDYIARVKTWVTDAVAALWPLSIARGGTGGDTAEKAAANLGVWRNSGAVAAGNSPLLGWNGTRLTAEVPGYAYPFDLARMADIPTYSGIYEGYLSPNIYNRATSGAWRSLAVQSDGTLAQTASARRFKDNITPTDITDAQLAQLQLVEFDWTADGTHDIGVIADDVEQVLPWAVFHDENGLVLGVHYDRLGLALLPVVQRLVARVAELEKVIADAKTTE